MTIGLPLEPEPCGWSSPVQEPPSWKRIWFPAVKVVLLTLEMVCQGVLAVSYTHLTLPTNREV